MIQRRAVLTLALAQEVVDGGDHAKDYCIFWVGVFAGRCVARCHPYRLSTDPGR